MKKRACLLAILVLTSPALAARAAEAPHFPGAPAPGELKWRAETMPVEALQTFYLDYFAACVAAAEKGTPWKADGAGGRWTTPYDTGRGNIVAWTAAMGAAAFLVARDGSDECVRASGLTREALTARTRAVHAYLSKGKHIKFGGAAVNILDHLLASGEGKKASSKKRGGGKKGGKGGAAKRALAFDAGMEQVGLVAVSASKAVGGRLDAQGLNQFAVPQDMARRDELAGKPYRDWIAGNRHYAPEFTSHHHGYINVSYAFWPYMTSGNFAAHRAIAKLLMPETWMASHMPDMSRWAEIHADGSGLTNSPMGWDYGRTFARGNLQAVAYHASVHKDPAALAIESRLAQTTRLHISGDLCYRKTLLGSDYSQLHEMVTAYLMHKGFGGPEKAIPFAEAGERLGTSFHYRTHQYVIHRSREKWCSFLWRGGPEKIKGPEVKGTRRMALVSPISGAHLADPILVGGAELSRGLIGRVTKYPKEPAAGPRYTVTADDATLATAGVVRYGEIEQYQLFASFPGKTALTLVRLRAAGAVEAGAWQAVPLDFFLGAPGLKDRTGGRRCAHAAGALDLKAAKGDEGFRSSWWCVEGRLGLALTDTAEFKTSRLSTGASIPEPCMAVAARLPLKAGAAGELVGGADAAVYANTSAENMAKLQKTLAPLDEKLPTGWAGLVAASPEGPRVLAVARFWGKEDSAELALSFPEGAPVLRSPTVVGGRTARAKLALEELGCRGEVLSLYATGNCTARRLKETSVELAGAGAVALLYIPGGGREPVKMQVALEAGKPRVVELEPPDAEDRIVPFVEITSPIYLNGCLIGGEPEPHAVGAEGMKVEVAAADRSGLARVELYLNREKIAEKTQAPWSFTVPKEKLPPEIHNLHAVAVDASPRANAARSFDVPFRVE